MHTSESTTCFRAKDSPRVAQYARLTAHTAGVFNNNLNPLNAPHSSWYGKTTCCEWFDPYHDLCPEDLMNQKRWFWCARTKRYALRSKYPSHQAQMDKGCVDRDNATVHQARLQAALKAEVDSIKTGRVALVWNPPTEPGDFGGWRKVR